VRLFIATSLKPEIQHEIDSVLQDLRVSIDQRYIRWVKWTAMHVTLKFLGESSPNKIPDIKLSMDQVVAQFSPIEIALEDLGCFPNMRRPRILWLGIKEQTGSLQRLQGQLENEMSKLGFPKEKRKFHPHLTLGRAKARLSKSDYQQFANQIGRIPPTKIGHQHIDVISLIESDLKPSGPVYTTLHKSLLGGGEW
jgi:2'-5' RNA ligase